jgi:hypothetical protein
MKLTVAFLGAILVGLSACSKPIAGSLVSKPTVGSVAGEYVGHYGGATERIILRPDGTLRQELKDGGGKVIYTNEGKWNISTGPEDLEFWHFYVAVDLTDGQLITRAAAMKLDPKLFSVCQVGEIGSGFQQLTLAPDTPYFFERVASPGTPSPRPEAKP